VRATDHLADWRRVGNGLGGRPERFRKVGRSGAADVSRVFRSRWPIGSFAPGRLPIMPERWPCRSAIVRCLRASNAPRQRGCRRWSPPARWP